MQRTAAIVRCVVAALLLGLPAAALPAAPGDGTARPGEGLGASSRNEAARARDSRAFIVESNLKDINASLEPEADARPAAALTPGCPPRCPPRAELAPAAAPSLADRALRGNLHRLQRDVVVAQSADLRQTRVEETLDDQARKTAPAEGSEAAPARQ